MACGDPLPYIFHAVEFLERMCWNQTGTSIRPKSRASIAQELGCQDRLGAGINKSHRVCKCITFLVSVLLRVKLQPTFWVTSSFNCPRMLTYGGSLWKGPLEPYSCSASNFYMTSSQSWKLPEPQFPHL